MSEPNTAQAQLMKAIRSHPPAYDIRVEQVPIPKILHPDDAIVKVQLAGLCGSDLHVYRGTEGNTAAHISGHEIVGEVVELGESFGANATTRRPTLYKSLKVGDKVVAAFSTNCGECGPCRLGYSCRCIRSCVFGSEMLDGGQAQYIRVPDAGGTLFSLSDPLSWPSSRIPSNDSAFNDASLLLLADNLPTGVFAATQILNHPKVLTCLNGQPYPTFAGDDTCEPLKEEDRILTIAIIGLGPVGTCGIIALLDFLHSRSEVTKYRMVGVDLNEGRREKVMKIYAQLGYRAGEFVCVHPDEALDVVNKWTNGVGCTAILEAVGHPTSAPMKLAYKLVRPFGLITSVGVHGDGQLPLTAVDLWDKNISLDFGRCPARAMIPRAFKLLVKRQDIFGNIGGETSLIDRIVSLEEAREAYRAFDAGEVGKVLFDPWK